MLAAHSSLAFAKPWAVRRAPARILAPMDCYPPKHLASAVWHPGWLRPQWPAPDPVRTFCTSREGGFSAAPYDSLNLGQHVGDLSQRVAANRRALQQALGVRMFFLDQVHGTEVLELPLAGAEGAQADGSWTRAKGLACTVMVADCLPVLMCTQDGDRVAALHAGWRGLAGVPTRGLAHRPVGVVQSFMERQAALGISPSRWMAWLGPCIGPQAFEVGAEVRAAFMRHSAQSKQAFVPQGQGKWRADLALLARQRLESAGVSQVYGNDGSAPWCTVGNPLKFFSHRRDRVSGRFAAGIWLA